MYTNRLKSLSVFSWGATFKILIYSVKDNSTSEKNYSTKLVLIEFVNVCIDAMKAGETVTGCFAELSNAFDCVNLDIPIEKMVAMGIKNSIRLF